MATRGVRDPEEFLDNHTYCYRCRSRVGDLYHCDACARSYHPRCSDVLLRTLREGDTKLGDDVRAPWKCDVCTSCHRDIAFHDEEDVVVRAHASSTLLFGSLLQNMKHDATNPHVPAIHAAFVRCCTFRPAPHRTNATTSEARTRARAKPRVTVSASSATDAPPVDDAEAPEPPPEPTDDAPTDAQHTKRMAKLIQAAGDRWWDYSSTRAQASRGRPATDARARGAHPPIRCMEWGCTQTTPSTPTRRAHADRWLCTRCRRVGVRVELPDLARTFQPRFGTIQRVYPDGHVVDVRFDHGLVDRYRLDARSWRVDELPPDRRFINLTALFVPDPRHPRVEHTHQDDLVHFFAVLQFLRDHERAVAVAPAALPPPPPQVVEPVVRMAIGRDHPVQACVPETADARRHWPPSHVDGHSVLCGIAFNSMMGSYTSGRQLPLYVYARAFQRRLCIWRTVARIADSAPITSFEREFAERVVPVYQTRYAKAPMGVTRQRFVVNDQDGRAVLEWTYLIRHDPMATRVADDPIARSDVMCHNQDSCDVLVERLAVLGVVCWDFSGAPNAKATKPGSGADASLGVYVRYLWRNFAQPAYAQQLYAKLKRLRAHFDGAEGGMADLMLFVILLLKSLGDLGSACSVRALNDRLSACPPPLPGRPPTLPMLHTFLWTHDRHVSSFCAILTNGYVLFTPSLPDDNGVSIHGTFFAQRRWFDAICAAFRLTTAGTAGQPLSPTAENVGSIVIRMILYVSAHLRGHMSFATCQQRLRRCCAGDGAWSSSAA
jgi:hypothetical protein